MNKSIYLVVFKLNVDDLFNDWGVFFGLIIGMFNYIFVGDIIWFKWFVDYLLKLKIFDYVWDFNILKVLGVILYFEFKNFESVWIKMDEVIWDFVYEFIDEVLEFNLLYSNIKGELFNKKFGYFI